MSGERSDTPPADRSVTTGTTTATVASASRPTSLRVVDAVADERGVEPMGLDPLYEAIDPDSLDSLFPPAPERPEATSRSIAFTFAGYQVTIDGAGAIDVTELDDRERVADPDIDSVDETTHSTD
ncbi:HalOD1 output domain-containing protein [Halovivax ruber]|uniref:HalOD1 output domain-containing protein n=1 Tax=Halovivax ruber TaxID=387341 RepID=UPI001FE1BE34|nr:HalOD1 output domain-containing protein [Halovivax ruber]